MSAELDDERERGIDDEGRDYASFVVGTFVGIAGLLFLAEPLVAPLAVGNVRIRPMALSVVVLTVGMGIGAVVYLRRGRRLVGIAHGIGAGGWSLVALGTAVGSGGLLLGGVLLLVGGSAVLVAETRHL